MLANARYLLGNRSPRKQPVGSVRGGLNESQPKRKNKRRQKRRRSRNFANSRLIKDAENVSILSNKKQRSSSCTIQPKNFDKIVGGKRRTSISNNLIANGTSCLLDENLRQSYNDAMVRQYGEPKLELVKEHEELDHNDTIDINSFIKDGLPDKRSSLSGRSQSFTLTNSSDQVVKKETEPKSSSLNDVKKDNKLSKAEKSKLKSRRRSWWTGMSRKKGSCNGCYQKFGMFRRKKSCSKCNKEFCKKCSHFKVKGTQTEVCFICFMTEQNVEFPAEQVIITKDGNTASAEVVIDDTPVPELDGDLDDLFDMDFDVDPAPQIVIIKGGRKVNMKTDSSNDFDQIIKNIKSKSFKLKSARNRVLKEKKVDKSDAIISELRQKMMKRRRSIKGTL